jgi:hypothetical protein
MAKRYLFIYGLILLWLTACGSDTPDDTTELVLPTAVVQTGTTPVPTELMATAIVQPTAVLFLDTPTPAATAVITDVPVPSVTPLPPTLIASDMTVIDDVRPFLSQDLLYIRHYPK